MADADSVRVLVVGDGAVGKTSVVHLLVHGTPIRHPVRTVGCSISLYKSRQDEHGDGPLVEFVDVAGISKHARSRRPLYSHFDGVVLVHDTANRRSASKLWAWVHDLPGVLPPAMVVGTKTDISRVDPGAQCDVARQLGAVTANVSCIDAKTAGELRSKLKVFLAKVVANRRHNGSNSAGCTYVPSSGTGAGVGVGVLGGNQSVYDSSPENNRYNGRFTALEDRIAKPAPHSLSTLDIGMGPSSISPGHPDPAYAPAVNYSNYNNNNYNNNSEGTNQIGSTSPQQQPFGQRRYPASAMDVNSRTTAGSSLLFTGNNPGSRSVSAGEMSPLSKAQRQGIRHPHSIGSSGVSSGIGGTDASRRRIPSFGSGLLFNKSNGVSAASIGGRKD